MARFDASYAGIGEMLVSGFMQAHMRARAEKVAALAQQIAPYDPDSKDGTHYRDAFEVSSGVREGRTRRAYGRVENHDDAAFYVEYGTKNNPAHHTLGKALDAARD
jgi:hypothetical protein